MNISQDVNALLDRFESQIQDDNLVDDTNELITLLNDQNVERAFRVTLQRITTNLEELKNNYIRRNTVVPSENLRLLSSGATTYHEGGKGRPRFDISKEALIGLREMGQSWSAIADMFSVSRWTVYRRAHEYDISHLNMHTQISDEDLLEIISIYVNQQSRLVGFSMIYGHLCLFGIRVQHARLRELIRRLDPEFSRLRWAAVVHRRSYNVRSPNSLWHIDGHHSLVKYGFVIHGAIDGYSRMITFLKCSTNNRSDTVLELFVEAIDLFGILSRIRTDRGGENVLIWDAMENLMGRNRGSALRGTSTQNQRIERLWRDVFRCVASTYYYLFQAMVESGILNIDILLHKIILHFVFIPRINASIQLFTNAWNNHPLRTERNKSPVRIWQSGMADIRNRELQVTQNAFGNVDDLDWYGYDSNVPQNLGEDDELGQVVVNDVVDNYPVIHEFLISQNINPLQESNDYGIDIFLNALQLCVDLLD